MIPPLNFVLPFVTAFPGKITSTDTDGNGDLLTSGLSATCKRS